MSNLTNYPQYALNFALELLFPKRCIICSDFNSLKFKGYLCNKCLNAIPLNNGFECIGCLRLTPLGTTCHTCSKTNSVDQLLVVADYKNPILIKLIKLYKYRFVKDLGLPISILVKKYLIKTAKTKKFNLLEENPILLSVPLNKKRLNWRGFNQSTILAKLISEHFSLNYLENIILKTGESKPQAEIKDKEERLKNLDSLFKINRADKITGRNILLIDDVCTTGTTLNECAKILKEQGAKKIIGLVVARG